MGLRIVPALKSSFPQILTITKFILIIDNMSEKVALEIRAGTGGEEAKLFAQELLRMYQRYAEKQKWAIKSHDLTLTISGENVYSKLKHEAGVHRVQRIPATEKSGRVHTSTATVAVLSAQDAPEIKINPVDLRIESFRGSGPGGQHRNVTDSAIRITHLPTGIVVSSQNQKSQHQNKAAALQILENRLKNSSAKKYQDSVVQERREQIGQAERSEKIRTYNFPQNRITDHRINKSWQNLEQILNGNLEKIIVCLERGGEEK
ncbi:MAG: peptide chain release factor-like protein [bacterium]